MKNNELLIHATTQGDSWKLYAQQNKRHERVYIIWFSLCEVYKQAKLTREGKSHRSGSLWGKIRNWLARIWKQFLGNSLEIQWLRLHASPAGSMGLIPGQGSKIQHAAWQVQKKGFWCDGNILCLIWSWDIGCESVYSYKNVSNFILKICAFHFMSLLP